MLQIAFDEVIRGIGWLWDNLENYAEIIRGRLLRSRAIRPHATYSLDRTSYIAPERTI